MQSFYCKGIVKRRLHESKLELFGLRVQNIKQVVHFHLFQFFYVSRLHRLYRNL